MNDMFRKYLVFILFLAYLFPFQRVEAQNKLKILAIGNSFSEDAVEFYLKDIAKADGVTLTIGNMYIGGCSLETHWINAYNDFEVYSYRKITNGNKVFDDYRTLQSVIAEEPWDIITFQQVSQNAGILSSYFPYFTDLLQYTKSNSTNSNVKYAFHQTWAYAVNSTHTGFANYNNDQQLMYRSVVETVKEATNQVGINCIIPSGTAIQNGRNSSVGDNFCRDGYHLSLGIGRYTAACVWYEKLVGRSVIRNKFIPEGLSASEIDVAQRAAHAAVLCPDSVTSNLFTSLTQPTNTKLSFYPNPVKSTVRIASDHVIKEIIITNLMGEPILSFNGVNSQNSNLDIHNLPSGFYLIKIDTNSIKFLKTN